MGWGLWGGAVIGAWGGGSRDPLPYTGMYHFLIVFKKENLTTQNVNKQNERSPQRLCVLRRWLLVWLWPRVWEKARRLLPSLLLPAEVPAS